MKAGIVVDKWKFPFYEEVFNRHGYELVINEKLSKDLPACVVIEVETGENPFVIQPIIMEANNAAMAARMEQKHPMQSTTLQ